MEKDLNIIKEEVLKLEKHFLGNEMAFASIIDALPQENINSARNFIHYLSLRSKDIRELQIMLHHAGLSSLSISEGHIYRQIQSILLRLDHPIAPDRLSVVTAAYGKKQVLYNSQKLFGKGKAEDIPALMVTLDAAFVNDDLFFKDLLHAGMNVVRINCAHDAPPVWTKMIKQTQKASQELQIPCKIYMDLAGPKIRVVLLRKGHKKGSVNIEEGNTLYLAYSKQGFDKKDIVIHPGEQGIIEKLQIGHRVYIDDGMVRCLVESVQEGMAQLKITRISSLKKRIKAEKGINFPDTPLDISPLTEYDENCLPFIYQHADMVGYSFVKDAKNLRLLKEKFKKMGENHPPIIIKIETLEAVKNLPELIMEGLKDSAFGVMIARGDLAVEIGFERLVEIQEEILWLCEAAHVPVVWATQVLETLNKSGVATRSEITDAGHAALAECVMINKGAHTLKVLYALNDIFMRQVAHRYKKSFTFRKLEIAHEYLKSSEPNTNENP